MTFGVSGDNGTTAVPAPHRQPSALHIGWIMPPFVRELPVGAPDAASAARDLYTLATEFLPNHSAEDQYLFALGLGAQLEPMAEADVIYAGLCFLETEGGRSASTIVVSQVRHESNDEEELLNSAREALERKHPDDDYQRVELPCGPALTRVGAAGFTIAAEFSPTGKDLPFLLSQIRVYIPLPGTDEMLIFGLDSPSQEAWDLHSELFAEVLKTVDWGTDQEIEDYRAMSQRTPVAAVEPDEEVRRDVHWHSSRLLEAVALRGHTTGGQEINSVTCTSCWGKGLRSPCSARHSWRVTGVAADDLPAALSRITSVVSAHGWRAATTDNGDGLRAWATDTAEQRSAGYSFTVSVDSAAGVFSAEVTSPCGRTSAASDSVFG